MKKEELYNIILKWIGLNYGSQEMEDTCYNIDMLCDYIMEELENE